MKYIANPVEVDAHRIIAVEELPSVEGGRKLALEDRNGFEATKEMMSRYIPQVGDYVVIQSDGYTYLNPKEVFERKYHPYIQNMQEKK